MPPAATRFDCRLSVMRGTTLQADYADIFFPADVAQARKKVVEVWRKATKGDALATQILDSQVAFMEKLGLIA